MNNQKLTLNPKYSSDGKGGTLLLLGLAAVAVLVPFLPWWEREWTIGQIGFFAVCALGWLFRAYQNYNELQSAQQTAALVDAHGIQSLDPARRLAHLSWSEITSIEDLPYEKMIVLHGPAGVSPFRLAYQLDGFAELLPTLLEKVKLHQSSFSLPITLRKSRPPQLFFLLVGVPLAGAGGIVFSGDWLSGLMAALGGLTMNIFMPHFQQSTQRLVIHDTGFRVHERFTTTECNFDEVQAISLVPKSAATGFVDFP